MYCGTADRTIVASWPGYWTGDTVYETATGRQILVSGSSQVPMGYTWDTASTTNETAHLSSSVRIAPEEEPPRRPKYVDPAPRPIVAVPKVRPNFRVFQRLEFHARSNPRR